jgi:hypothetical protein
VLPYGQLGLQATLIGNDMSKGPGRVEQAILKAFGESAKSYTVEDLFHLAYPDASTMELKHRVAIKRACSNVCARTSWKALRKDNRGGGYIYYDPCDVISYASARIKGMESRYQSQDPWVRLYNPMSDAHIYAQMSEGGRYYEYVVEGGTWWKHARLAQAERDGDEALHRKLDEELKAEFAAWANAFKSAFSKKS